MNDALTYPRNGSSGETVKGPAIADVNTSRRRFLGASGAMAGLAAAAGAGAAGTQHILQQAKEKGNDLVGEELAELKRAYNKLDKRTQMLWRAVLILAGVDLFLLF